MEKEDIKYLYYVMETAFSFAIILLGIMGCNWIVLSMWECVNLILTLLYEKKVPQDILSIEKVFFIFRITLIITIAAVTISLMKSLKQIGTISIPIILPTIFVLLVVSVAATLLFEKNEEKKEKVKAVMGKVINNDMCEERNDLDVVLCVDEETGQEVTLSLEDRFLHMLIIGATGTGKTSQILIKMLLQDIEADNRSIIVLEPKGDFAEQAYALAKLKNKKTLYFNPKFVDCPTFNPFYGEEDEVVENMTKTFNAINRASNVYYQVMAETLLRNGLMVLKRLESQPPRNGHPYYGKAATLMSFNTLIHNSNGDGLKVIKDFLSISNVDPLEKKQNADIGAWFKDDYFSPNGKVYQDTNIVRAQISKLTSNKYLRRCLNPDGTPDIIFENVLEDDIVLAIGTEQGLLQDLGSFLGLFLFLSYQAAIFRRKGDENTRKPNFFYCDEFQQYADTGFKDVLQMGRSYCVSANLATQARTQIGMNMDPHKGRGFIEVVSTNARNVVLFPGASTDDVEYYSRKFGEVKKKQVRTGVSRQKFEVHTMFNEIRPSTESKQETDMWDAQHTATDLMFKDFGTITYQIVKNKTLQRARVGTAAFIDKDLYINMKKFVSKFRGEQEVKREEYEEELRRRKFEQPETDTKQKKRKPIINNNLI